MEKLKKKSWYIVTLGLYNDDRPPRVQGPFDRNEARYRFATEYRVSWNVFMTDDVSRLPART